MADQTFQINIKTLADLTGIKITQQQLEALQGAAAKGNQQAIDALNKLVNAQKQAASGIGAGGLLGGLIGGFAGGALSALVGVAISQFKELNAEQDRMIEQMEKVRERTYELGLEFADTVDKINFQHAVDSASTLQVKLDLVAQRGHVLQQELNLAFAGGRYDDAKKYLSLLEALESQFNKLTQAQEREKQAAEKAAEANAKAAQSFMDNALENASPQVKAALLNEQRAKQTGDQSFQKTADQLKASMTEAQRQEYEGLTQTGQRLGRKAGPVESQSALDDIARNKINFERQLRGEPPLPQGNGAFDQSMLEQALRNVMSEYWGGH